MEEGQDFQQTPTGHKNELQHELQIIDDGGKYQTLKLSQGDTEHHCDLELDKEFLEVMLKSD